MLLYLTSDENIGLFDFLTDESGMLIKKYSGEFSFEKFVVHDMRNLSHFSYVIIDLKAMKDDTQEIIESLNAFKAMYNSRIIIFAEEVDKDVLDKIIEETETYNIITAENIDEIKEEIRICISPQGMNREYILKAVNNKFGIEIESLSKYTFKQKDIKIVLAGAMNRVGTTTTAMNIANFLAKSGAKVSYTEANNSNHLLQIHSYFFPNIPIDKYFSYKEVNYFFNASIPVDGYNFNIIDIGILNERKLKVFEIGDVKILCGGNKPYELKELKNSLELINTKDKSLYILLPESKLLVDIKKKLSINQEQIYTTEFSYSLFDSNINNDTWESILNDYIIENEDL